jgi:nitrite reductase/ring-hydroxylating ferredoxin subunit
LKGRERGGSNLDERGTRPRLIRRVVCRAVRLGSSRQPGNLIIICICASSAKEFHLKHLCNSDQLAEGKSRGFDIDGVKLLAVRRSGQVYVYENHCPHRGIPLEWQPDRFLDDSASLIQCATHGALFLIENGECIAGPCEGKSLNVIAAGEDAQGIWVNLPALA